MDEDATRKNQEGITIIEVLKISKEKHMVPAEYAQKLLIQTYLDVQNSKGQPGGSSSLTKEVYQQCHGTVFRDCQHYSMKG